MTANNQPLECPIAAAAQEVVDLSGDLTKAMRRLRRDVLRCKHCKQGDGCTFRINFTEMVDVALAEVVEELDLENSG